MNIDWTLVATISAPVLALFIGVFLDRLLERKVNLLVYYGHITSHQLRRENPITVNTHAIILQNAGRKSATDVRISHDYLPPDYSVFPKVEFSVVELEGGTGEIVIPRMVPGEEIHISYLYYPPITYQQVNGRVRHSEGFAKGIDVLLQRQYPNWVQKTAGALMLVGIVAILYVLAGLVQPFVNASG